MDGFGSINDLKNDQTVDETVSDVSDSLLHVSSGNTSEKFDKKMDEIAKKELEVRAQRFANQLGLPHIDLIKFPVTHEALRQISEEQAQKFGVVCFYADQQEVRLGALDPRNPEIEKLLEDIKIKRNSGGGLYVISEVSFDRVLGMYKNLPNVKPITKDIEIHADDLEKVQGDVNDFKSVATLLQSAKTTNVVTILLGAGLKTDASDIHVEAEEEKIVVRFRLDGILHDVAEISQESYHKLLSRIKLVSALKINITNKPQDGRFTIKFPKNDVDVRVSTIPTVFGESIVMRLLRQSEEGIDLEKLGMSDKALNILKQEIQRPNGMIITTGPTGSGKTTTLYAILKILNKPGVKIITLEDPVEYRMEGINQSQIDKSKNYTFASGLKSILRQDPDIVMVGEIRDFETAEIAIQSALTGHLMLSTLHTNSAAGAIPRFLSMGTKPFLLAPALNTVMGQRLVRRICSDCRKLVPIDELESVQKARLEEQIALMPDDDKKLVEGKELNFYQAVGCETCNGIGYKGRIGIYEIFVVKDDIEESILSQQVAEHIIEKLAHAQDMTTMVQDGILKAIQGLTTLDEVFRVIE